MVAPLSTFAFIESRRARRNHRRNSDKHKQWLNFHMCLRITQLYVTKNDEFKSDFTRLFVCTILEFHNKWLLFLGHHCICFQSYMYLRNVPRPCSCGDLLVTHTTNYYNPPPKLGLITTMVIINIVSSLRRVVSWQAKPKKHGHLISVIDGVTNEYYEEAIPLCRLMAKYWEPL